MSEAITTLKQAEVASEDKPLRENVSRAMENYFSHIGNFEPKNLYEMVLAEVELPMLEKLMEKCRNNQCKASRWLGISRGTLRKKLKQYGLLD